MSRLRQIRKQAALLRRAALTPTDGGRDTDRVLLALAEQLEREAEMGDDAPPDDGALDKGRPAIER